MAKRGRKPKPLPFRLQSGDIKPPFKLPRGGLTEFRRLAAILTARGMIERVDLGIMCECARTSAVLNDLHENLTDDPPATLLRCICQLTNVRRGLLRDLGLTIQPSTVIRPVAPLADATKWAKTLKVS